MRCRHRLQEKVSAARKLAVENVRKRLADTPGAPRVSLSDPLLKRLLAEDVEAMFKASVPAKFTWVLHRRTDAPALRACLPADSSPHTTGCHAWVAD